MRACSGGKDGGRRLDCLDQEGPGDLTWAEVYAEMGDEP